MVKKLGHASVICERGHMIGCIESHGGKWDLVSKEGFGYVCLWHESSSAVIKSPSSKWKHFDKEKNETGMHFVKDS